MQPIRNENVQAYIEDLQRANAQWSNFYETDYKPRLANLQMSIQTLTQQRELETRRLSVQMEEMERENKNLKNLLQSLEKDNTHLLSTVRCLEDENMRCKQEIFGRKQENLDLHAQVDMAQSQFRDFLFHKENTESHIEAMLANKLKEAKQKIYELEDQLRVTSYSQKESDRVVAELTSKIECLTFERDRQLATLLQQEASREEEARRKLIRENSEEQDKLRESFYGKGKVVQN